MEYWVSLNNFRYTYQDIVFVLRHLAEISRMNAGQWVHPPEGSGYIDEPLADRSKSYQSKVPSSAIAGEIELKLGWCGLDGLLADALFHYQIPIDRLCRVAQMTQEECFDRVIRAIEYVSHISRLKKKDKRPTYLNYIRLLK